MFAPATRAAGLARLHDFAPAAGRAYAAERNHDRGPHQQPAVSQLSPYLRHRLVTEEEVVRHVLAGHSLSAAEKFVQEVYWRTYWKGWLEQRPSVFTRYESGAVTARDGLGEEGEALLAAAEAGRAGIEGFDDWARELVDTGYLHNHARMWFASIWIFTLHLPWQLGAEFFLRHLLDGDPASNTLSWRWVAGLQTRGKTYLATADNIARYTDGRFRPRGLATSAMALEEDEPVPSPAPAPHATPLPGGRLGLLLHDDDLAPETLPLGGARIVAVAAPASGRPRTAGGAAERTAGGIAGGAAEGMAGGTAEPVAAFQRDALRDGLDRAASIHGAPATALEELTASAIAAWAAQHDLDAVVAPYAPVGAVRSTLDRAAAELMREGLPLVTVLREWDARAWPHATRGFFPFRERIPGLLRMRGIESQGS